MEGAPMSILTCAVAGGVAPGPSIKARTSTEANTMAGTVARDRLMVVFSLRMGAAWHVPGHFQHSTVGDLDSFVWVYVASRPSIRNLRLGRHDRACKTALYDSLHSSAAMTVSEGARTRGRENDGVSP